MRNILRKLIPALFMLSALFLSPLTCQAETQTQNNITGYRAIISDNAELLPPQEEEKLLKYMLPITEQSNVMICTTDAVHKSNQDYAYSIFDASYDADNCILLLFNMQVREIGLYTNGEITNTVTSGHARSIMDNVYRHASKGDYFFCSVTTMKQVNNLLTGQPIPQTMKYICNGLLALILSLWLGYLWVIISSRSYRPKRKTALTKAPEQLHIYITDNQHSYNTEIASPKEDIEDFINIMAGVNAIGDLDSSDYSSSHRSSHSSHHNRSFSSGRNSFSGGSHGSRSSGRSLRGGGSHRF